MEAISGTGEGGGWRRCGERAGEGERGSGEGGDERDEVMNGGEGG